MNSKRIGRTLRTLVAIGAFATLTAGVAAAADPCRAACRATKSAGIKECHDMAGCSTVYRACKQVCRETTFGEDRRDCVESCQGQREDCREYLSDCVADCKVDALECRAKCVEAES